MSLFISFEGGEGSGKSTQAETLQQRLQQAGVSSLLLQEPGTTPLGVFLRDKLKQEIQREHALSPGAELFLFAAARAELVAKEISPALQERATMVIADRFADSTIAYQGYGRRLPLEDVATINRIATQGVSPNATFLLDCPPEVGLERLSPQFRLPLDHDEAPSDPRIDLAGTRRFERESLDFHKRVRNGYLMIADEEPDRWCVIDATMSAQEISDIVWGRVDELLSEDISAGAQGPGSNLPLWSDEGGPISTEAPN